MFVHIVSLCTSGVRITRNISEHSVNEKVNVAYALNSRIVNIKMLQI